MWNEVQYSVRNDTNRKSIQSCRCDLSYRRPVTESTGVCQQDGHSNRGSSMKNYIHLFCCPAIGPNDLQLSVVWRLELSADFNHKWLFKDTKLYYLVRVNYC